MLLFAALFLLVAVYFFVGGAVNCGECVFSSCFFYAYAVGCTLRNETSSEQSPKGPLANTEERGKTRKPFGDTNQRDGHYVHCVPMSATRECLRVCNGNFHKERQTRGVFRQLRTRYTYIFSQWYSAYKRCTERRLLLVAHRFTTLYNRDSTVLVYQIPT